MPNPSTATIPENIVSSTVSQEDADAKATTMACDAAWAALSDCTTTTTTPTTTTTTTPTTTTTTTPTTTTTTPTTTTTTTPTTTTTTPTTTTTTPTTTTTTTTTAPSGSFCENLGDYSYGIHAGPDCTDNVLTGSNCACFNTMDNLAIGGTTHIHEDSVSTANTIATHLAPKTFSMAFAYTLYDNSHIPTDTCVYAQVWSVTRTA